MGTNVFERSLSQPSLSFTAPDISKIRVAYMLVRTLSSTASLWAQHPQKVFECIEGNCAVLQISRSGQQPHCDVLKSRAQRETQKVGVGSDHNTGGVRHGSDHNMK